MTDLGLKRCPWTGEDALYIAYHDEEWGVPEYDDRALFEKLVLDGFQAGLSWITILRKRESQSRPDAGIVWFEHRGYNQHDDLVHLCHRAGMIMKKPADGG